MAAVSNWPELDDRPASHGETFALGSVAADVDLTARSGKPPTPTSAILWTSDTGGDLVLTMAGGGNITLTLPAASAVYFRIAVKAIVDTGTTDDGAVTVFWNAHTAKN